ncbi:MAG: NAD(P)/FAD-dependent oxidoreductase [Balneolales bacterium]|nr:NAD(P)/FAD-dependent oxidoreductase [Balneolales bacterium]
MQRKDFLAKMAIGAGFMFQLPFSGEFISAKQVEKGFSSTPDAGIVYDAIIIGGSYAGLTAAMGLGRCLRKVLVIDEGSPRNKMSPSANNLFSRDGQSPQEIKGAVLQQLESYQKYLSIKHAAVTQATKTDSGFQVRTGDGERWSAKNLIFASGLTDELQEISGLKERWGNGVYHCPYCHGWENRGKKIAVIGPGNRNLSMASMLTNWTSDLTYISRGEPLNLPDESVAMMRALGIFIIEEEVNEIRGEVGNLRLQLNSGEELQFESVFAPGVGRFNSSIARELGCETMPNGAIKVNESYLSNIERCYAIGDVSSRTNGQIIHAAYSGTVAAAQVNNQLMQDDFRAKTAALTAD